MELIFRSRIWLHQGVGSWHFVTLPKDMSAAIRSRAAGRAKPGGSLPVTVTIGAARWKTSIFFDRKRTAYLLPIKAAVRVREQLQAGQPVDVVLVAEFEP